MNKYQWGMAAFAVAASSLTTTSAGAAASGELHLTRFQYWLTDVSTGQAAPGALVLIPTVRHGPDGTLSAAALVDDVSYHGSFKNDSVWAPVPLTLPQDMRVTAALPRGGAFASVQVSDGQAGIDLVGQHSGNGTFSSRVDFEQGGWGLHYEGQGLLLAANTTLTLSANVMSSASIGSACPAGLGVSNEWCERAGATAYLELSYFDKSQQTYMMESDLFNVLVNTETIGERVQLTKERLMSVSLTNTTDQAMPIYFRYNLQVDGRSVPVPEPATWALWGLGLVGLACAARSKRQG